MKSNREIENWYKYYRWLGIAITLYASVQTSAANTSNSTGACTDPQGFITLNIAGNEMSSPAFNLIGLGLYNAVEFQNVISGINEISLNLEGETISVTQLTFPGEPFHNLQFDARYFLEIIDIADQTSLNPGVIVDIVESTLNTIILVQDISSLIAIGDGVRIRKHHTIASVFGSKNEAGLEEEDTLSIADKIILYNPVAQLSQIFFYSSNTGWVDTEGIPSGDTILYPDQGIIVHRLNNTDLPVKLFGNVKTGSTSIPFEAGRNLIANVYPITYTLDDSGLFTGNENSGIKENGSLELADRIMILSRDGLLEGYHYSELLGGWVDRDLNPSGQVVIEVGTAFILQRLGEPINWRQEQPY